MVSFVAVIELITQRFTRCVALRKKGCEGHQVPCSFDSFVRNLISSNFLFLILLGTIQLMTKMTQVKTKVGVQFCNLYHSLRTLYRPSSSLRKQWKCFTATWNKSKNTGRFWLASFRYLQLFKKHFSLQLVELQCYHPSSRGMIFKEENSEAKLFVIALKRPESRQQHKKYSKETRKSVLLYFFSFSLHPHTNYFIFVV